jgi:hypothetical protein
VPPPGPRRDDDGGVRGRALRRHRCGGPASGSAQDEPSRFERGADINAPVVAIERAIALMEQIAPGALSMA